MVKSESERRPGPIHPQAGTPRLTGPAARRPGRRRSWPGDIEPSEESDYWLLLVRARSERLRPSGIDPDKIDLELTNLKLKTTLPHR